jgi:glucose/arabinose dehydrogenase
LARAFEAVGARDVSLMQLDSGFCKRVRTSTVSHERAYLDSVVGKRVSEPTADETGRSGYQCLHRGNLPRVAASIAILSRVKRAVAIATLCCSLTFAVSACASSGDGSSDRSSGQGAAGSGAAAPGAGVAAKRVRLLRVGSFDQPTYLASPSGDRTRRFVTEREGRIVLLRGGRRSTFLDIASRVETGGESGLLSMAFHPGYKSNRRYYVYYVANDGSLTIFQFRATPSGNATREGSGRLVLRVPHPRFNHKGGQLQFGPDGMLYAGFGDGGGGGDPDRNAQDLGELLGKLVRIDPKPGGGYRVPRSNPFVGRPGARGEIFAYGLRNPYRFSFDRATGDLTIGDVGQDEVEEIDFLPAISAARGPRGGANLGWSVFEGNRRYRSGTASGAIRPAIERTHDQGSCSITGGYVLRPRSYGSLRGSYVYGDLCDSGLRVARLTASGARGDRALGPSVPQLVSFGEDARGRVYAVSLAGGVFRLAPRG